MNELKKFLKLTGIFLLVCGIFSILFGIYINYMFDSSLLSINIGIIIGFGLSIGGVIVLIWGIRIKL